MNLIDIILIIPIALGLIRGFTKGLLLELTGLAAVILGILSAIWFWKPVFNLLSPYFTISETLLQIVSYLLIFLLVSLIMYFLGRMLTKIVNFLALGVVNSILGGLFGAFKVIAVLIVLVHFYAPLEQNDNYALFVPNSLDESTIYTELKKHSPIVDALISRASGEKPD